MPNFFLDLRTLSFALMLVTGLMASVMLFVWRVQKTYPGTKYWVLSNFAGAIGFLMIGLREFVPDLVSILLGNAFAVGTLAFALEGNRRFLGLRPKSRLTLGIVTGYVAALAIFTYLVPDVLMRIVFASVASSMLAFLCYLAFFERPDAMKNTVYRTVRLTFLLFSILMFLRMSATLLLPFLNELYSTEWLQSVSFMCFLVFATVWSFNYVTLNSERLNEELRDAQAVLVQQATTDFLTGLSNKRSFCAFGLSELKRSRRYNIPTSLILFDLDHFKAVNDNFGHAVGDKVLSEVGALVRRITRQHDQIARLGGEEFGLILTHSDLDAGHLVAETLRSEIAQLAIDHKNHRIQVTASFGVAGLKASDTLESLMDRADANLYKAKSLGRNIVFSGGGPKNLRLLANTK